ncbi:MAG: histidine phosphatase family protein [Spirochaetia bacterium]|nr:histidine phosphatase family protein [Spirochaetia bacterium]
MDHKLILIRHAATIAPNNTLVGKNNVELSPDGIKDAQKLKSGIRVETAEVKFYSSGLSRAIQTGEILFSGAKFIQDGRINEIDFGEWTGLDINQISKLYPEVMTDWMHNPMQFKFPGGESVNDFIKRINDFLNDEILNKKKPVVLVCHGGVIRFILCRILNIDYSHHLAFSIQRPSLNVIDHDGKTGVLAGLNLTNIQI